MKTYPVMDNGLPRLMSAREILAEANRLIERRRMFREKLNHDMGLPSGEPLVTDRGGRFAIRTMSQAQARQILRELEAESRPPTYGESLTEDIRARYFGAA